jgi:hypothetical protein
MPVFLSSRDGIGRCVACLHRSALRMRCDDTDADLGVQGLSSRSEMMPACSKCLVVVSASLIRLVQTRTLDTWSGEIAWIWAYSAPSWGGVAWRDARLWALVSEDGSTRIACQLSLVLRERNVVNSLRDVMWWPCQMPREKCLCLCSRTSGHQYLYINVTRLLSCIASAKSAQSLRPPAWEISSVCYSLPSRQQTSDLEFPTLTAKDSIRHNKTYIQDNDTMT